MMNVEKLMKIAGLKLKSQAFYQEAKELMILIP